MFGLDTLDVGIGMALMFLFVSLIASAIREFIETKMKTRAKLLEAGIREMMGEGGDADYKQAGTEIAAARAAVAQHPAAVVKAVSDRRGAVATGTTLTPAVAAARSGTTALYDHFLISSLFTGTYGDGKITALPAYIPSASFARAVMDIAARGGQIAATTTLVAQQVRDGVENLPNGRMRSALINALDTAGDDLAQAQRQLEQWFDGTMDRVSGWYKRLTQYWLFAIGLGCAVVMNIDAVHVMRTLATDPKLRTEVVGVAAERLKQAAPAAGSGDLESVKQAAARMGEINWPIGWANGWPGPQYRAYPAGGELAWLRLSILLGWLVTAFGVTFGAAFWFDVLNKFMVIRSTIKPDEKSGREKNKDGASPAAPPRELAISFTGPPPVAPPAAAVTP